MENRALRELSAALRDLQLKAGQPSTRDIAGAIHYSHTTVAQILSGAKCPKLPTLLAVVTHLGGDPHEFKRLWITARNPLDPEAESADDADHTAEDGDTERLRPTVLRLTRTTARDGTRSEALEIFDRQLAQDIIRSYLNDDGDHTKEV